MASFSTVRDDLPGAIEKAADSVMEYVGVDDDGKVQLPTRVRIRLRFDDPGPPRGPRIVHRDEPSLLGFFERHWQHLESLPEIVELGLVLAMLPYVDLATESVGFEFRERSVHEDARNNGWEVTRPVVEAALLHRFHGEKREEYLPGLVARVRAGARRHYFAERHSAPIVKLEIEGPDLVEISEDMWLRRLSTAERTLLCDPDDLVPATLSDIEAAETFWILESDVDQLTEEDPDYHPGDPSTRFETILTALRIFRAGRFYAPVVMIRDLPGESATSGRGDPFLSRAHLVGGLTTISRAELTEVQSWLSTILPLLSHADRGALPIALRRFNESFLRDRFDDAILDAAIALEALLIGGKDQRGFGLRLRGSVLLGTTLRERQHWFESYRRLFETRNAIAHGNEPPKKSVGLQDVLDLEWRTFRAFLPFLAYGGQSAVLKALDAYFLSSPNASSLLEFVQDFCRPTYASGWESDRTGRGLLPSEPKRPVPPERGDSDDS